MAHLTQPMQSAISFCNADIQIVRRACMAALAMSSLVLRMPPLINAISHVVGLSPNEQVVRVAAWGIVASVANKIIRRRVNTVFEVPDHPVRHYSASI